MNPSRNFAIDIVKQLQDAKFTALWAGGCVRDQLLGKQPKDYDVATNATPDEVRNLFGKKRTLPIGASFGVITVLGPKSTEPIEVATFRRDSGYSDGRRPDSVEFTDAREDAIRRDFTINGMFFDPVANQVIDYVGGQNDLEQKIIRAIGNPHERIEEDKLRMLRAIRFASTLGFELEANTLAAVQKHAEEIKVVSGERIGAELRRMLTHQNRATATQLLRESKLLTQILKGSESIEPNQWQQLLKSLANLQVHNFSCTTAILIAPLYDDTVINKLANDWKLSNDEKKLIGWILSHKPTLANATKIPWSQLQPRLIEPESKLALKVLEAEGGFHEQVAFCQERLDWPTEALNPPPLMDGEKLKELGITPGPQFGKILQAVRNKQLDGEIQTIDEAIAVVNELDNA